MTKPRSKYLPNNRNDQHVCADGPCAGCAMLPVSNSDGIVTLYYCDNRSSDHYGHAIKASKHPACDCYWVRPKDL
jgi:hypothetical protein